MKRTAFWMLALFVSVYWTLTGLDWYGVSLEQIRGWFPWKV